MVQNKDIDPGEQIGIRLAHLVLADLTQDSLSAFHSAGIESGTNGQNLRDIIDGIRDNSSVGMCIQGKPKKSITYRTMRYYITGITNSIIGDLEEENFWYDIGGFEYNKSDIIIRFYLDYHKIKNDDRTLHRIAKDVFQGHTRVYCSPDFMGIIDVHVTNMIEIAGVIEMINVPMGIPDVLGCLKVGSSLITTGSNLQEVCCMKNVDPSKTISNDIYDVERTFGLEAANRVIYNEMISKGCDKRASIFISNFMTCKGYVSPFHKDNPMLRDKGILTSIAFERPKKDIKESLGKHDDCKGSVYSQIMTGAIPNVGTGSALFRLEEE